MVLEISEHTQITRKKHKHALAHAQNKCRTRIIYMHVYACTDTHLMNSHAYVPSHALTHTLFCTLLPPPNHSRTCVHTNTPTSTTTQTTTFTPYTHTITTTQTTYTHTHIIAQPSTHQYQGDRELGPSVHGIFFI